MFEVNLRNSRFFESDNSRFKILRTVTIFNIVQENESSLNFVLKFIKLLQVTVFIIVIQICLRTV